MYRIVDGLSNLKRYYSDEQVSFVLDSVIEGMTLAEVYVDCVEASLVSYRKPQLIL
ncbi:hypothetical protein [Paenibacillus sp. RC67]|uniref:hypothetical protein n=1 Tax=Paenibacillus sp. RC67 TaxID=3039392 RepID=UPI0024AD88A5|nr:hypothetical protein [Paenibacillus sp. RC67]